MYKFKRWGRRILVFWTGFRSDHWILEPISIDRFGKSFSYLQLIFLYKELQFIIIYDNQTWMTFNAKPLKLGYLFIYLDSNISYTESNVNIQINKSWSLIDKLKTIWKSDLSDRIGILLRCSCVSTTVWLHHLLLTVLWWAILNRQIMVFKSFILRFCKIWKLFQGFHKGKKVEKHWPNVCTHTHIYTFKSKS